MHHLELEVIRRWWLYTVITIIILLYAGSTVAPNICKRRVKILGILTFQLSDME